MFGRKKRRLSDFDSEIKSHLDLAEDQYREEGLDEREAHYAALRQFGNVTIARERFYEVSRWQWLDALGSELRHALKNLLKTPRFTLPAVLIGAIFHKDGCYEKIRIDMSCLEHIHSDVAFCSG